MKRNRISLLPENRFSVENSIKYFVICYVFMICIVTGIFGIHMLQSMSNTTNSMLSIGKNRLEERVGTTVNLLNSLAKASYIVDPNVTYQEKISNLDSYSKEFGYMMVCYVDQNGIVWSNDGSFSNLSKREYIQQLFSTGKFQVTDSFLAGSDGTTLNYTIAAPILQQNKVNGCIFAAIYFDELKSILCQTKGENVQQFVLLGKNNQIMNATDTSLLYGEDYNNFMKTIYYIGTNPKEVERYLYDRKEGSYWSIQNGMLYFSSYSPVKYTKWMLFSKVSLLDIFSTIAMPLTSVWVIITLTFILAIYMNRRFMDKRLEVIHALMKSVYDLERRIYQNDRPGEIDFKEIIKLTSKGLTDGLTGVVTRTVFFDQVGNRIKTQQDDSMSLLAFVDVDNLKNLNDSYGHEIGDMALKSIGYVLREYEKRYDGLIGRYGGDEFIMFLTDFSERKNVMEILDEMSARLHVEVSTVDGIIKVHCSVGAVMCTAKDSESVDELVKQADACLYEVKRNGKGHYRLL